MLQLLRSGYGCVQHLMPNHALPRTRPSRPGCNRSVSWAGSLSLSRWTHRSLEGAPSPGDWQPRRPPRHVVFWINSARSGQAPARVLSRGQRRSWPAQVKTSAAWQPQAAPHFRGCVRWPARRRRGVHDILVGSRRERRSARQDAKESGDEAEVCHPCPPGHPWLTFPDCLRSRNPD